jgi:hypothetical protein
VTRWFPYLPGFNAGSLDLDPGPRGDEDSGGGLMNQRLQQARFLLLTVSMPFVETVSAEDRQALRRCYGSVQVIFAVIACQGAQLEILMRGQYSSTGCYFGRYFRPVLQIEGAIEKERARQVSMKLVMYYDESCTQGDGAKGPC